VEEFLWNIAAVDRRLISNADAESKRTYTLIGGVLLFLIGFIFLSVFFTFHIAFKSWLMAGMIGGLMAFIITIVYWLNLLTLEPNMLPHIKEKGVWVSVAIRITVVLLFSFYITSCFVIFITHYLIGYGHDGNKILEDLLWFYENNTISAVIIQLLGSVIFLSPILLKLKLKDKGEYFYAKGVVEKKLIRDHYLEFKSHYSKVQNRIEAFPLKFEENYTDPPFNTKKKVREIEFKSQEDFLVLMIGEPKNHAFE
jgi:hypothetical protein